MSEHVAGATVGGRYRLERPLGEGGMGEVWAATHQVTRGRVALKFLKTEFATRPQIRQRFLREARAACAVKHPNIVQIHDVLELDDGTPVMIMDLLDGETLADRLAREGAIPLDEVAKLLMPVLSALGAAHASGIVHRDLKPENLFLARVVDGAAMIKVLDFGIAKLTATEGAAAETGALTGTGTMLGTPYYMSPEQAFGERDIDHRTDIWALGIILYQCLAGHRPVEGDNLGQIFKVIAMGAIVPIAQVMPALPPDVADLVTRMLQTDRARRPSDLREVRDVLGRYATAAWGDPGASLLVPPATSSHADAVSSDGSASGASPPMGASLRTPEPMSASGIAEGAQRAEGLEGVGGRASRRARVTAAIGISVVGLVVALGAAAVVASQQKAKRHDERGRGADISASTPSPGAPEPRAIASSAVMSADAMPLNCVSFELAERICEVQGKRLPTEAEWEFAAGNQTERTRYPWGASPDVCAHTIVARGRSFFEATLADPSTECRVGPGAPVIPWGPVAGGHPLDVTMEGGPRGGLRNMSGNLSEWIADKFAPYADPCWTGGATPLVDPRCDAPANPPRKTGRSVRGGSWGDPRFEAEVARRGEAGTLVGTPFGGVRCAKSMS